MPTDQRCSPTQKSGSVVATLLLAGCASSPPPPVANPSATDVAVAAAAPTVLVDTRGLRLEQQRWQFGDEAGLAWRVRVPLAANIHVVPSEHVVPFETFDQATGVWATINGGFYENDAPMGLVVTGGVEHAPVSPRGGSGIFQFGDGGAHVVHRDVWQPGPQEALQSVDRLVADSASVVVRRDDAPIDARSAVVVSADAVWLVALASDASISPAEDGVTLHDTTRHGLPLWAFADYLRASTGAVEALNLDGAVSTQLAVHTPDRTFRVHGERGTIDAIAVAPR